MRLADVGDVNAVNGDVAILDVIEPVDEIGDGGLAGTCAAHKGNLLVGHGVDHDVEQHLLVGCVAEVHHVHLHATVHLDKPWLAAVGGGNAPCPNACAVGHGNEHAVAGFHGIDQCHLALVGLGGLVQDAEHALGTHAGVEHTVDLLAHLGDGTSKALVQRQEGHQCAQRERHLAAQDECGTHHADEHIAQVAQVAVDRHDDIGDAVGIISAVAQLLVDALKLLDSLSLVAEDLDHTLAGHHLLNIAVDIGQSLLLHLEVTARPLAQCRGDPCHEQGHNKGHERQRNAQGNHAHEGDGDGDERVQGLWQTLVDHLAQGVDIVGEGRHHLSVRVGVEVADGQLFHVAEHVVAQAKHGALGDINHQPVVRVGADDTHHQHSGQFEQCLRQWGKVGVRRLCHRHDVVVDERAGEQGRGQRSYCRDDDAHRHRQQRELVVAHHQAHQAHQDVTLLALSLTQGHLLLSHSRHSHCAFSSFLPCGASKSPPSSSWMAQIS